MLLNDEKAVACHGIGACSKTCPKGLDPKTAIRELVKYVNKQKNDQNQVSE
jgi:succinate dehydrogenase/fumarate reductase-like Fe-S protein